MTQSYSSPRTVVAGLPASGGTAARDDFDEIVDSYMPAAVILMMTRGEVESAVLNAMRMDKRCESCRYSRAPHHAVEIAQGVGILPIYRRRCIKSPPMTTCPQWEQLKIPQEFLDRE